jgi:hypothetical protein
MEIISEYAPTAHSRLDWHFARMHKKDDVTHTKHEETEETLKDTKISNDKKQKK